MIQPLRVLRQAFKLWWDEWFILTILHIGWLMAQCLIVTGPPATAVLFAMVRRTLDGDYWEHWEVWEALRRLFWPAWRWAGLNLAIGGVALFNLLVYEDNVQGLWPFLRLVWIVALLLWGSLNLFYWPFWLAQADKSMRTTYANCGRFLLMNAWQAPVLILACLILAVLSVFTTLPFALALFVWLALLAETAVRQSVAGMVSGSG